MLVATAKAHVIDGSKRYSMTRQIQPHNAERTWPPTKFRGCAKGERGAPKTNTADAPNEPIKKDNSRLSIKTLHNYFIRSFEKNKHAEI